MLHATAVAVRRVMFDVGFFVTEEREEKGGGSCEGREHLSAYLTRACMVTDFVNTFHS